MSFKKNYVKYILILLGCFLGILFQINIFHASNEIIETLPHFDELKSEIIETPYLFNELKNLTKIESDLPEYLQEDRGPTPNTNLFSYLFNSIFSLPFNILSSLTSNIFNFTYDIFTSFFQTDIIPTPPNTEEFSDDFSDDSDTEFFELENILSKKEIFDIRNSFDNINTKLDLHLHYLKHISYFKDELESKEYYSNKNLLILRGMQLKTLDIIESLQPSEAAILEIEKFSATFYNFLKEFQDHEIKEIEIFTQSIKEVYNSIEIYKKKFNLDFQKEKLIYQNKFIEIISLYEELDIIHQSRTLNKIPFQEYFNYCISDLLDNNKILQEVSENETSSFSFSEISVTPEEANEINSIYEEYARRRN
jgi:hypothetical protein